VITGKLSSTSEGEDIHSLAEKRERDFPFSFPLSSSISSTSTRAITFPFTPEKDPFYRKKSVHGRGKRKIEKGTFFA